MSLAKLIVKKILRKVFLLQAHKKINNLHSIDIVAGRKIANAINDALKNNVTPDEREWISKIERLRVELNNDLTEISHTDYGAGNQGSNRNLEEMRGGVVTSKTVSSVSKASKSPFFALLLFKLIREFKPEISVELGTCLGVSASYQGAALKLNRCGRLITIEGAPLLASLSEKNIQKIGLDNVAVICGRFQDKLLELFQNTGSIDYVFIDGHHDDIATVHYFKSFLPHLADEAVIVFDDISWSSGMRRAWREIIEDENIKMAVDLREIGVCFLGKGLSDKFVFKIPLI